MLSWFAKQFMILPIFLLAFLGTIANSFAYGAIFEFARLSVDSFQRAAHFTMFVFEIETTAGG